MRNKLSLIYPYYNSAGMLEHQMDGWLKLPEDILKHIEIILVDDGSPIKPALPVINAIGLPKGFPLSLYRVKVDIPWNQHGCRNLGAKRAKNSWLFLSDIDHVLPDDSIRWMLGAKIDPIFFYTLQRVTAVKKEDGNLKYDLMTDAFGKAKPHPNTFLVARKTFWETGGYDEDFCGVYGGDGPFARWLERVATRTHLQNVVLIRWTRDQIPDASQPPEYREKYRAEYRKRFEKKGGSKSLKPANPVRFPWEQLI